MLERSDAELKRNEAAALHKSSTRAMPAFGDCDLFVFCVDMTSATFAADVNLVGL